MKKKVIRLENEYSMYKKKYILTLDKRMVNSVNSTTFTCFKNIR